MRGLRKRRQRERSARRRHAPRRAVTHGHPPAVAERRGAVSHARRLRVRGARARQRRGLPRHALGRPGFHAPHRGSVVRVGKRRSCGERDRSRVGSLGRAWNSGGVRRGRRIARRARASVRADEACALRNDGVFAAREGRSGRAAKVGGRKTHPGARAAGPAVDEVPQPVDGRARRARRSGATRRDARSARRLNARSAREARRAPARGHERLDGRRDAPVGAAGRCGSVGGTSLRAGGADVTRGRGSQGASRVSCADRCS